MNAVRTPGNRGRLPVKPPGERFPIRYISEYATEPFLAPSYPIDVSGGITDWGMLGNGPDPTCTTHPDGVGDCTFAAREHLRMAKAAAAGTLNSETWEDSNDLVAEYLKYDHGRDEGANIADLLLAWYKAGKILAFAPVDVSDVAAMDAAMQAFDGLYVGVNLTDDADQLFGEGKPWTVSGGQQPDPNEGHCIVKFRATGKLDEYGTWGALQPATVEWSKACVEEAWVLITSEDAPVNLPVLKADIDALHGTGGGPSPQPTPGPTPFPVPAPTPTPVPPQPVDDPDAALAAVADEWVTHHHTGSNAAMATALKKWLAAKNLSGRQM